MARVPAGAKANPWTLKTPSGQSEYEVYQDETLDPPALVVKVGKTELRYHARCITDLHAMLKKHGDWMLLGSADEQNPRPKARWRLGHAHRPIRLGAGTD